MPHKNTKRKQKPNKTHTEEQQQPHQQRDTTRSDTTTSTNKATTTDDYRHSAYEQMSLHLVSSLPSSYSLSTDVFSVKVNRAADENLFPFHIYTSSTDQVGRRVIADTSIAAGTVLFFEQAVPCVIHQSYVSRVCSSCLLPLSLSAQSRACLSCNRLFYCSTRCLLSGANVHRMECKAMKHLDEISDQGVNVDLVRAALAYCVMKAQEQQLSSNTESKLMLRGDTIIPTCQDVECMAAGVADFSVTDQQRMSDACTLLLSYLPSACHLPIHNIVTFMSQVNHNSHALSLSSGSIDNAGTEHIGFGLFPLCSLLNHSCFPNCIFVNQGSALSIRLIRDISAHEELCVNYIGLYASTAARRAELLQSKGFVCQCHRCLLAPRSEVEKHKFLFDQFLCGIKCKQQTTQKGNKVERCTGIYRIMHINTETTTTTTTPSAATAPTDSPLLCSECGDALSYAEYQRAETEYGQQVEDALQLYATRTVSAAALLTQFTTLQHTLQQHFHPAHHLLFNLTLPLINLLNDAKERYTQTQQLLTYAEQCFPDHFLPTVNYYAAQLSNISKLRQRLPAPPKSMLLKYKEQQCVIAEKMAAAMRVCLGNEHEQTKIAEREWEQYKQSRV